MSQSNKPTIAAPNALGEFVRTLRLVWRLLQDSRVGLGPKLVPVGALLYLFSPIDLLPDFIFGLGQLDDLGIILLGIKLFFELCPKEIVAEHRLALSSHGHASRSRTDENVIEGSYRVIHDDEPPAR